MNVTDKAAEVATTTVEALKSTPMTLALVLFNLAFIAAMVYVSIKSGARADDELARLHELVAKAIAACGPVR